MQKGTNAETVQNFVQKAMQTNLQMSVKMLVQYFVQKNGSDVEQFAERKQKVGYKLYGYSTKSDAEKYEYDGFAQIIFAAKVTRLFRFYPPNPPIRGLISVCAPMQNAVQSSVQMLMQILVQSLVQNHLQIFVQ